MILDRLSFTPSRIRHLCFLPVMFGSIVMTTLAGCKQAPVATNSSSTTQGAQFLLVEAPATGKVARAVRSVSENTSNDVLVYVGAKWCEPCRRFLAAARDGTLASRLPRMTIVKFDHDRDHERLALAGYRSKMIPLFAVPTDDGNSSGKHVAGSIKGPGAVDNIVRRLRTLLRR